MGWWGTVILAGQHPRHIIPFARPDGMPGRAGVRRKPNLKKERRRRYRMNENYEHSDRDLYDDCGRAFWIEIKGKNPTEFLLTTPENPYRVLHSSFGAIPDRQLPDQPMLQFWTWQTSLHVILGEDPYKYVGEGLCRWDIADFAGDWCGSIVLDEDWFRQATQTTFEFIAISESKEFTEAECPVWTYYIPKERHESEWDVFYVLLIEYNTGNSVYQRVALGKVFRAAFAGCSWKEIILG